MKLPSVAACSLSLLGTALLAQNNLSPILVVNTPPPMWRQIPDEVGGISAIQMVRFDPDADQLVDLAIRWDNGKITFGNAPEVMASFVDCPTPFATGMARIPASFALGSETHDGLVVATGANLEYLTYDAAAALASAAATGFSLAPVPSSPAWQQVVEIETYEQGSTLWIVGLAADRRHVRIGQWTHQGIVDSDQFQANDNVRQLTFIQFDNNTPVQVAARTQSALEFWMIHGGPARPSITAPTANALGMITRFQDENEQHLAWLVLSGSHWQLRIFDGHRELQDSTVSAPGFMPLRFRPIGLAPIDWDSSGSQALVLSQNCTTSQIILTKGENDEYAPSAAFESPDITYGSDTCPPLLDDINHDGNPDFTIALASQHCVQIDTRIAEPAYLQGPSADDDYLPVDGSMSSSPTGAADDTINLHVRVPAGYVGLSGLEVQVVAWPHYITDPFNSNSVQGPIGNARANVFFGLVTTTGTSFSPQPILPLTLPPQTTPGSWSPNEHYYLMLRFVRRTGDAITWTSPARMFAFVANQGSAPTFPGALNYVHSIMSPQGHDEVRVPGGNRNVGVVLKPRNINPPSSAVKVPNPGPSTNVSPSGTWPTSD